MPDTLDQFDRSILEIVQRNCQLKAEAIADQVGLSASAVQRRLKRMREEKVITAAVKQSLKSYHPAFEDMTPFKELVTRDFSGRKFIAHCGEAVRSKSYLASTLKAAEDAIVLIGPEGDFSAEEVALAVENGFEEITLGTQRLRTETAAVVAVTMVAVINTL